MPAINLTLPIFSLTASKLQAQPRRRVPVRLLHQGPLPVEPCALVHERLLPICRCVARTALLAALRRFYRAGDLRGTTKLACQQHTKTPKAQHDAGQSASWLLTHPIPKRWRRIPYESKRQTHCNIGPWFLQRHIEIGSKHPNMRTASQLTFLE
ncbi:hypothetical protein HRR83_004850 [Exophiala dermatitidis]|nr:hypothetical protein HRR73_003648 [Exophiala dermatitidis]KAJ4551040.1 hypothetical protein HRR77_003386 [Exophiala dermatitidis]KAJ4596299.1 hypothetical protein HRR83_004850 [Exophiala dermatitidis]KAJ4617604.1 hypothetical protein HRR85_002598 [Exophiala dermatitidis]KAJ4619712.1 hypothetical protein HRR88_006463 [Exophiala dermatitidis]